MSEKIEERRQVDRGTIEEPKPVTPAMLNGLGQRLGARMDAIDDRVSNLKDRTNTGERLMSELVDRMANVSSSITNWLSLMSKDFQAFTDALRELATGNRQNRILVGMVGFFLILDILVRVLVAVSSR